jgi:hypothetical protein
MNSREELAWAAGFFDGEGSTCKSRKIDGRTDGRSAWAIRVSVGQKEREPLERFQRALGFGAIYTHTSNNASGLIMHYWNATSLEEAQAVMAALWIFLSGPKRSQFVAIMEAYRAQPHIAVRLAGLCNLGLHARHLDIEGRCPSCRETARKTTTAKYRASHREAALAKAARRREERDTLRGYPVDPEVSLKSRHSMHLRWHVKRNLLQPDCHWCSELLAL